MRLRTLNFVMKMAICTGCLPIGVGGSSSRSSDMVSVCVLVHHVRVYPYPARGTDICLPTHVSKNRKLVDPCVYTM